MWVINRFFDHFGDFEGFLQFFIRRSIQPSTQSLESLAQEIAELMQFKNLQKMMQIFFQTANTKFHAKVDT